MNSAIIIGSGIVGASTAYQLAKRGIDVTVIDREEAGQATKAAAGIICPWYAQRRNKAWYSLADQGAVYYTKLIDELTLEGETNTGYKRVGMIGLHTDEERLIKAEDRVLKRKEATPEIGEVKLLNEKETTELFPLLDNKFKSLFISGGARVDGKLLNNALIRAAKKHGATFIKGDARLIVKNNTVHGVKISNEKLFADKTIAATGAWMNELLDPVGLSFTAHPQKAQLVHLLINNSYTGDWPVIMPPNNQYILPNEDGKIIVGATHETKAGFDLRITAGGVYEVLSKAIDIAPELAQGTLTDVKVGFRPFTRDSIPVIGSFSKLNHFLLATGLGASGLTIGPFIGKQLALLALNEELSIDLDLYRPENALKEK